MFGTKFVMKSNFLNFVRVRFDGVQPAGGSGEKPKVDGSRGSPKFEWHVRHTLVRGRDWWVRTTGDENESEENDVGDKHKPISR